MTLERIPKLAQTVELPQYFLSADLHYLPDVWSWMFSTFFFFPLVFFSCGKPRLDGRPWDLFTAPSFHAIHGIS